MDPTTSVQFLRGVGPARARLLGKLGIATVGDLLHHYPRVHDDRREMTPIGSLRPETHATVRGRVRSVRLRERGHGRLVVVEALVEDATGLLQVEFWQQAFRAEQLQAGRDVILSGRVTWGRDLPLLAGPEVETVATDEEGTPLHGERIVPIHPLTKGIWPTLVRVLVWRALEAAGSAVEDLLPEAVRRARDLPGLEESLREIHFPTSFEALDRAKRRLKYEELFLLEVALALRRRKHERERKPHRIVIDERLDARIRARFPFTLTAAQERVVAELRADLAAVTPMNRLLQGDVGSGKTAVAVYAMLAAVARKVQAALLAPTEILAEQHHATLSRWLAGSKVRIALVSGRGRKTQREEARRAVAAGKIDLVVGTHALLEEDVRFRRLGLVVVDEQHRFGVLQRGAMARKGLHPDVLVMSATPIPRTLTMTVFGDLDVSILDELPPGRSPVTTVLCAEGDRAAAYDWVRREIARGRRAYHVVPLVEEHEELPLRSAMRFAEELRAGPYRGIGVGVLHGRLRASAKDAAMEAFRSGATPILVATSVVEVGVDVPEATVLCVEHAERFGLAQLHQLRGRVGRGAFPSRTILFHDARTPEAIARLRALCDTTDGFRIAEEDLRIRGPGEFLGTRQHGLTELRIADLVADAALLAQARKDAFALVDRDPDLTAEGEPVRRALTARFGARSTRAGSATSPRKRPRVP